LTCNGLFQFIEQITLSFQWAAQQKQAILLQSSVSIPFSLSLEACLFLRPPSVLFEQLLNPVESVPNQPENPFAKLIPDQKLAIVPSFTLESGVTLYDVPVAYTTRGQLSSGRDNALIVCHALSGSADVADWWGPLMGGTGQAFDATRFFIVCLNSLGSPYGSASPVTSKDGDLRNGRYGPEFPLTTIRDDVK
jgi:homoserine O-acetyltransferase/O-succinyltransferase